MTLDHATILRIIFWLLFFWFLYLIKDVILMLVLALIIASAISPIASWLQRYLFSRILSVILIYILAGAGLSVIFYLVIPIVFDQTHELIQNIPVYSQNVTNFVSQFYVFFSEQTDFSNIAKSLQNIIPALNNGTFNILSSIFGGIFSAAIVLIISFWLSIQERGIENFLKGIAPAANEEYVVHLWLRVKNKIGLWLQGQLLLSALVGLLVFFGLTLLSIPYALMLAILAGMMELMPIIGPILASLPAIILGFLISPLLGSLTLILYFVIQRLENDVFIPLVMQKMVGVSPILVIISLLIGAKLLGILGMVISVPLAAAFTELYNDFVEKKKKL